mgnify:CR=1 FL=1
MNMLGKTSPYFDDRRRGPRAATRSRTATSGSRTCCRAASRNSETRMGQQITVRATYHQDLIVPLISAFLPKDANGRMTLIGEVTMVIN